MNQNYQFPNSGNFPQPIYNNFIPQSSFGQASNTSHMNNNYLTSNQNVIQHQQPFQQNNFINQQMPVQSDTFMFFCKPPNDPCNYHITCIGIPFDTLTITQLLNDSSDGNINSNQNEYTFYYQQKSNGQIYQIICEIVTPFGLNKTVYGIEIAQSFGQDQSSFTLDQKQNLKLYLIQCLSNLLY
ncbi:hypothetical protein RhiirA5_378814 [Rhizophagus irregularis]|uniref:Uncharacterized protein n=1 Tax=Rhizophagus irregularis TaxID=588596 RepID=A0A2I1DUN5_9GLOM|nr:hypothetical protein RhiirA5_378814 [Rhizophagus irregularis]PKC60606.1 hypothetical protein RhiirA1_467800 [Rhizophagus irregularis]PKY13564.1 hypothetical protein RhiirB3_379375 [Rhizophagus irregularis]CAB4467037.1 unnamed protein product [Rhizophagus irregularis]CAB5193665.1 unnamed protein product [Rhizophagus irregularis]